MWWYFDEDNLRININSVTTTKITLIKWSGTFRFLDLYVLHIIFSITENYFNRNTKLFLPFYQIFVEPPIYWLACICALAKTFKTMLICIPDLHNLMQWKYVTTIYIYNIKFIFRPFSIGWSIYTTITPLPLSIVLGNRVEWMVTVLTSKHQHSQLLAFCVNKVNSALSINV